MIISLQTFDNLPVEDKATLRPFSRRILSLRGSPLLCRGLARLSIKLGKMRIVTDIIVADISEDVCIVGLDVLKYCSWSFDFGFKMSKCIK